MINLALIEQHLTQAMKARDLLLVDVLRGLKTRLKNEQIATGAELSESQVVTLLRSEVKRRKESATVFTEAGRQELADKELKELEIISQFLPAEVPKEQVLATAKELIASEGFTVKDRGRLIGALKGKYPDSDGAFLSEVAGEALN